MKPLDDVSIFHEFRKLHWDEHAFHGTGMTDRWFTKDGLCTDLLTPRKIVKREFRIFSERDRDFSESLPRTVVDSKSLSEWIKHVEMKYKFSRM